MGKLFGKEHGRDRHQSIWQTLLIPEGLKGHGQDLGFSVSIFAGDGKGAVISAIIAVARAIGGGH